jgi:hypothetical protein
MKREPTPKLRRVRKIERGISSLAFSPTNTFHTLSRKVFVRAASRHAAIVFASSDASVGVIIGGAMPIAEVLTSDEMMN